MMGRNIFPQPAFPFLTLSGRIGIAFIAGFLRKFRTEDRVN
jgi:hypothetical protein